METRLESSTSRPQYGLRITAFNSSFSREHTQAQYRCGPPRVPESPGACSWSRVSDGREWDKCSLRPAGPERPRFSIIPSYRAVGEKSLRGSWPGQFSRGWTNSYVVSVVAFVCGTRY